MTVSAGKQRSMVLRFGFVLRDTRRPSNCDLEKGWDLSFSFSNWRGNTWSLQANVILLAPHGTLGMPVRSFTSRASFESNLSSAASAKTWQEIASWLPNVRILAFVNDSASRVSRSGSSHRNNSSHGRRVHRCRAYGKGRAGMGPRSAWPSTLTVALEEWSE